MDVSHFMWLSSEAKPGSQTILFVSVVLATDSVPDSLPTQNKFLGCQKLHCHLHPVNSSGAYCSLHSSSGVKATLNIKGPSLPVIISELWTDNLNKVSL